MSLLLVVILVLLQLVDGWSTYKVLRKRLGREANPVVEELMDFFGLRGGLAVAKGGAIGLVVGAYAFGLLDNLIGKLALFILAVMYLAIVANNLKILYGRVK